MALPDKGSPAYTALAAAWRAHREKYAIPGPGLHAAFDEFADRWWAEHRAEYE